MSLPGASCRQGAGGPNRAPTWLLAAAIGLLVLFAAAPAAAVEGPRRSIADAGFEWPSWAQLVRVLSLRDFNTLVVIGGTMLLGLASGIVGSFMLLRKRALVGDALSHATLPGVALAFILMTVVGREGKALPVLLLGATVTSVLGMATVLMVRRLTRLKEDAALAIVLSVFFGLGVVLLGLIQKMSSGNAAGLATFIYGKTASMLPADVLLIAVAAGAAAVLSLLFFKEFTLVCFDQDYAAARGWPVLLIDALMMGLVIAVTVIGLQAVGLILMIALLVIPPAAARFWTHHLPSMVAVAALIGAVSGLLGAAVSALMARMPAGAIIVLVAGALFALSMVFGTARGVLVRAVQRHRLDRTVGQQNLLRAFYEAIEAAQPDSAAVDGAAAAATIVSLDALLARRSWGRRELRRLLRAAEGGGLVEPADPQGYRLTLLGRHEAQRVVRNHRLWEAFLIAHADIAPSHVDRAADRIEHVLGAEMVARLESLTSGTPIAQAAPAMPASPHGAAPATGSGRI